MLLVRYYIGRSDIHGMGLFSGEDIKKERAVWVFDANFDIEIPASLAKSFMECDQHFLRTHAEYIESRSVYILGNDGDIFMNHSECPTLIDCGNTMIAARDIFKGEELTCDYKRVIVQNFPVYKG